MSGFGIFTPKSAGTILVVPTTSSGSVANLLTKPATATAVRIKNVDATNIACFAFGTSTVTAALPTVSGAPSTSPASMAIGPGESVIVGVAEGVTHVAAISVAGTPNLYFTVGNAS